MKYKYAIFDFCETLVQLQTADNFVKFALKSNKSYFKFIIYLSLKLISRYTKIQKTSYTMLLQGMKSADLDKYACKYAFKLQDHAILKVTQELKSKKDAGYRVIIVSGGYDCYLKYFMSEWVDEYIGTELEISDNIITGKIRGLDCIGEAKLIKLKECGVLSQIDYKHSVVYSDCISDLPLFRVAKEKVIVKRFDRPSLDVTFEFRELTWKIG